MDESRNADIESLKNSLESLSMYTAGSDAPGSDGDASITKPHALTDTKGCTKKSSLGSRLLPKIDNNKRCIVKPKAARTSSKSQCVRRIKSILKLMLQHEINNSLSQTNISSNVRIDSHINRLLALQRENARMQNQSSETEAINAIYLNPNFGTSSQSSAASSVVATMQLAKVRTLVNQQRDLRLENIVPVDSEEHQNDDTFVVRCNNNAVDMTLFIQFFAALLTLHSCIIAIIAIWACYVSLTS